jgi:uncharacterized protein DUF3857
MTLLRRRSFGRVRAPLGLLLATVISLWTLIPAQGAKKQGQGADAWPEITVEERSLTNVPQDPDADAVVLSDERDGKIVRKADDVVNALTYHRRLKVLTERGKRYGEVHLGAEKRSRVSNIQARTVKPDGTIVPVSQDQIFEKLVEQVGTVKVTEWVFNFPAVEPGAILEYRYERHDNFLLFLEPWFFAGPEFTLRSRVTQAIPADMGYAALCVLCPPGEKTAVSEWREAKMRGNLYTREMRDIPGYRDEMLMPPQREATPRIEFALQAWRGRFLEAIGRQDNLFPDWDSVGKFAWFNYDQAIKKGQPAFKSIVEGWLQGIVDPEEKIRSIVRHVQRDFRYIRFYSSVIGDVRPIETLVKERTADNEEKAVLLLGALKTIGVEGSPALVAGKHRGSLNPKFFTLSQFSHTIVGLPQPGGTYRWIDPTVTYAPFGFMPWMDSGAGALLLKKEQSQVLTLPVKNELSATKYRVSVTPRADGKADLEVEAEYTGEDAIEMRDELVPAAESVRLSYLQKWVEERRPGAALRSHAIENLDDADSPLRLKMSVEAPGLVSSADGILLIRGCVLSCYGSNPFSRGGREHPFYVDIGWNTEETVVLKAPPGMQPAQMPPPAAVKSAIGTMMLNCTSQAEGSVRCSRQFVARRNRWPATEHENIRAMFDKIIEADRTSVAFEAGTPGGGR